MDAYWKERLRREYKRTDVISRERLRDLLAEDCNAEAIMRTVGFVDGMVRELPVVMVLERVERMHATPRPAEVYRVEYERVVAGNTLLAKHVQYTIQPSRIHRRFSEFDGWLGDLLRVYPFRLVPRLPDKTLLPSWVYGEAFHEARAESLGRVLKIVSLLPAPASDFLQRQEYVPIAKDEFLHAEIHDGADVDTKGIGEYIQSQLAALKPQVEAIREIHALEAKRDNRVSVLARRSVSGTRGDVNAELVYDMLLAASDLHARVSQCAQKSHAEPKLQAVAAARAAFARACLEEAMTTVREQVNALPAYISAVISRVSRQQQ